MSSVTFGPEGRWIAADARDPTFRAWVDLTCFDVNRKKLPDVLTDGRNPSVELWNARTGRTVRTLVTQPVTTSAIAFSPDGSQVALGGGRKLGPFGNLELYRERLSNLEGSFRGVDTRVVEEGGTVTIYDMATGGVELTLNGQDLPVLALGFGARIISMDSADILKVYSAKKGQEFQTVDSLKEDNQTVFSMKEMNRIYVGAGPQYRRVNTDCGVAFDAGNNRVAALRSKVEGPGRQGRPGIALKLWDIKSGRDRVWDTGIEDFVSVALSPDGTRIACGRNQHAIYVWDFASFRLVRKLEKGCPGAWILTFSPDGLLLASGHNDGVKVWDVGTGRLLRTARGPGGPIRAFAFRHGSLRVASGGNVSASVKRPEGRVRENNILEVWDIPTTL